MSSHNKRKFVISIFSPIGAQGVTLLAGQLCHHLSKAGATCLLDLNLDLAIGLHYLGKDPQKAFRHSAISTDESTKLSSFAIKIDDNYHAVGVPLLGYGHFAEDVEEAIKELFEQCRSEFDYTVIDLPHVLHSDLCKQALSKSDLIIYLVSDDSFAIESANTFKHLLGTPKLKALKGKEVFVLNRPGATAPSAVLAVNVMSSAFLIAMLEPLWEAMYQANLLPVFLAILIGAMIQFFRTFIMTIKALSGKSDGSRILKGASIDAFHELPNDRKSCLLAINLGKFIDEKSTIGHAIKLLGEKVRGRLEQSKEAT